VLEDDTGTCCLLQAAFAGAGLAVENVWLASKNDGLAPSFRGPASPAQYLATAIHGFDRCASVTASVRMMHSTRRSDP
jgi:hypothetical protein